MKIINPIYTYTFETNYEEGYECYHKNKTYLYPKHNVIKVLSSNHIDGHKIYYTTIYAYEYMKMIEVLSNLGIRDLKDIKQL